MSELSELELSACTPVAVYDDEFNLNCSIPYGCSVDHIRDAMRDFIRFLSFINHQLNSQSMSRLETLLMPANFSSLVGEFMHSAIVKYCPSLTKNEYHNGHPDLVPVGHYEGNAILHGTEGIEIKASRHLQGWQGHNAEAIWLMVFVFNSNSQSDARRGVLPRPFRFVKVLGAQLGRNDWSESGRSGTSRRTPTASVIRSGYEKMTLNWIYMSRDSEAD